jgi:hypothetical protein
MTFTFINDGDLLFSRLVESALSRYQADCCDFVSVLQDCIYFERQCVLLSNILRLMYS